MDIKSATQIRDHALAAIEDLSRALNAAKDNCDEDTFSTIKKGVGMSIIRIDSDILSFIYRKYPELDHIK